MVDHTSEGTSERLFRWMANEERISRAVESMGLKLLSLDDTKRETARRLLAGWRMRDETCPVTEFPLLEKGGETWSVRLGLPVRRAAEGLVVNLTAGTEISPASTAPARLSNDDDVIAGRIGEKLLKGWTMLEVGVYDSLVRSNC